MDIDLIGFESLVWVYGSKEGIITPTSWEQIICKSVGGNHVPGDIFMADGIVNQSGLNIKSLCKEFTKGKRQTCSFVQCRCPLDESSDIGIGVIKTLIDKREESFRQFNLNKMMDVIILHNREDDDYSVRLFISEQDRYEDLDLEWRHNCAYLNSYDKDKNWKLKRIPGNASAFQTCLHIKKVFDVQECVANFTVKCDNDYDVSIEEAKEKYAKIQQK